MAAEKAEETHSVRLPKGMADQVRAASGQKLSPLVRYLLTVYLQRVRAEREASNG